MRSKAGDRWHLLLIPSSDFAAEIERPLSISMPKMADKSQGLIAGYHKAMNDIFMAYGSYIAKHPIIPLILGILLLGGLCLGLLNAKTETDLEKLWVRHNSEIVGEKEFFDSRWGGISRKQIVTITPKETPNQQIDLKQAMDALTTAVVPIYNSINYSTLVKTAQGTKIFNLTENDFCERPPVPRSLMSGTNPWLDGNFLSWGYQAVSSCIIQQAPIFPGVVIYPNVSLPIGWGIDQFPCIKLSPMDCFREGQDLDYPLALKQLETPVGTVEGVEVTIVDLVAGTILQQGITRCLTLVLKNTLIEGFLNHTADATVVDTIVTGVGTMVQVFYVWGYRWRPSYRSMSNDQILQYVNDALQIAREAHSSPTNPAIAECVAQNRPCCMTWFGVHSPLQASLGGVVYDNTSNNITKVAGIRWVQNNFHQGHPLWADYINDKFGTQYNTATLRKLVKSFESLLIQYLDPLRLQSKDTGFARGEIFSDYQVEFNMWRSSEDVLADANRAPVWQIILSGVLVFIYASLAFANFRDPVHSHTWLASTGILVVSLAVFAGFGLTAALGIRFSPLAGSVVPFLALGLGIDDVFVMCNILRNYLANEKLQALSMGSTTPKREMRLTLALAGPSVVLTTFSVLAAFFISSINPMPIVQWFCWQMGITATVHTCGVLLIFMPIMALDARRTKAGYHDPNLWPICGLRARRTKPDGIQASSSLRETPTERDDPSLQENAGHSFISRMIAKYYAPLFESEAFKIGVVIFFSLFLGAMTYLGFAKVEHGLKLSDVTLAGSYQNTFSVITEDKFVSYDLSIVTRGTANATTQQNLVLDAIGSLQNLTRWVPAQPSILDTSWIANFYTSTNTSQPPMPADIFYASQQPWMASPLGGMSVADLHCEDRNTGDRLRCIPPANQPSNPNLIIGATKMAMFAENLGASTGNNLAMITETRKALKEVGDIDVTFMYGYPFLFYEQYLHSSRDLYTVVGLALVGVFLAVLIFQFSLSTSFIVALVLLMVDLEVYGCIYLLGAKLNSLSLVNLGIVIGMAAEFTYLARAFLVVEGTRNQRVGKALAWTFEPLLHGFGTQIASTLPLLFIKYHAFRVYYFGMFTIMGVLGFVNGFILLPVLLSWFGPPPLLHIQQKYQDDKLGDENGGATPPPIDSGMVT